MVRTRASRIHVLFAAVAGALLLACGGGDDTGAAAGEGSGEAAAPSPILDGPHDVAVLTLKGLGDIEIELLPEVAPKTVDNFIALAEQGFYDGTQFHRVIPDFMIQGGDPNTKEPDAREYGKGDAGYPIDDEFNAVRHVRGIVSMANSGTPNSGSCQFFILHGDAPHLDGRHTAFGRVVAGMDVVDAVTQVPLDTYGRYGPRDRPYPDPVVIEKVRIERVAEGEAAAG